MSASLDLPLLAALISAGFIVEGMVGFGSALVSLSLAGLFWPVQQIIPIQVAINLPVSAYIVARYHRDISSERLLSTYLPFTVLGLLSGVALSTLLPAAALDALFGLLVLALALLQLPRLLAPAPHTALPPLLRTAALLGAGVMHGLYAIGGPLLVLVAAREEWSKGAFRATLSALWLILGLILTLRFTLAGRYTQADSYTVLILLIPVALATRLGEWLHHRVAERPFRACVAGLLILVAGKLALSRAAL